MSDQPKPTGEWTGIMLSRLIKERGYLGAADALNARITAEREKYAALTGSSDEVIEIDEQGKITKPKPTGEWTVEYLMNDLCRYWPRSEGLCAKIADAHNAELAAERGNTKQLVDALKDIRVGAPDIVKRQIKDALEKVKEGEV